MPVRYFVVDARRQLRKAPHEAIRGLWEGRRDAGSLGCAAGGEIRLVSIACDAALLPRKVYLLRVPAEAGVFTAASRLTLRAFSRPGCVTPGELARHHTAGWPRDFHHQLAVAFDVPVAALEVPVAVGGPLLVAAALRVTPGRAVRYLR